MRNLTAILVLAVVGGGTAVASAHRGGLRARARAHLQQLERVKARSLRQYPGTPACGQCYQRACMVAPYVPARPHRKLVANFYTGVFKDGDKAYDCQHAVVVLRPGYSSRLFRGAAEIPLKAIQSIVDPDLPGVQTVAKFAQQRNGIRLCHAGPRGPWDAKQVAPPLRLLPIAAHR